MRPRCVVAALLALAGGAGASLTVDGYLAGYKPSSYAPSYPSALLVGTKYTAGVANAALYNATTGVGGLVREMRAARRRAR
jgi:hypothetical protein